MAEAYLVDALRSPTGKRAGSLSQVHPMDLGAHVIKALVDRNGIPAEDYDDVVWGTIDAKIAGCERRNCIVRRSVIRAFGGLAKAARHDQKPFRMVCVTGLQPKPRGGSFWDGSTRARW